MATLDVYLFGGFHLESDGEPLPAIPVLKGRSLFAYLIAHRKQPHTRDLLAGLFWPDMPDARARRRLSQALWQIRRSLEVLSTPELFILADTETVQFNTNAPYWLDVEEFQSGTSSTQLEGLRDAVALYSGEFLAGFYDDWAIIERERLRGTFLLALDRLIGLCKARNAYEEALTYARQLALHDPLREKAHREIIRLCHFLGRTNEALQQYEACCTALAEELGAQPTDKTTTLYHKIAARAREAEDPYLPLAPHSPPSPVLEEGGPVPLVGRRQERASLVDRVEQALGGRGGLILVEGEPGVGKTRLLQKVAQDAGWREMQVLWGRGRELDELPPYDVLSEALGAGLSPLRAEQLS